VGVVHLRARREAAVIPLARRVRRLTLAAALLTMTASAVSAHQEPYSYLDIHLVRDGMRGRVIAHVVDLAHEAGLETPDSLFDTAFVARRLDRLHAVLDSRLMIAPDGVRMRPVWGGFEIVRERRSVASLRARPPTGARARSRSRPTRPHAHTVRGDHQARVEHRVEPVETTRDERRVEERVGCLEPGLVREVHDMSDDPAPHSIANQMNVEVAVGLLMRGDGARGHRQQGRRESQAANPASERITALHAAREGERRPQTLPVRDPPVLARHHVDRAHEPLAEAIERERDHAVAPGASLGGGADRVARGGVSRRDRSASAGTRRAPAPPRGRGRGRGP